jgi:hypothetical protein
MQYSRAEFLRLVEAVEDQHGQHLDEACSAQRYELTGDKSKHNFVVLPGCGKRALFEVPYEATNAKGEDIGIQPIKLCAYDDMMGLMPRFADQVNG